MDNIQDLNQSPIDYQDEANQSLHSSSSEEGENYDYAQEQTFKGSFLLQMEKLTRPLVFEKQPYCIYSLEYDQYQENVLCFISQNERDEQNTHRKLQVGDCEDLIIDFSEKTMKNCPCQCHKNRNGSLQMRKKSQIQQRQNNRSRSKQKREQGIKQGEKIKKIEANDRKWTSISLKQYKQHIKKKLQEKR